MLLRPSKLPACRLSPSCVLHPPPCPGSPPTSRARQTRCLELPTEQEMPARDKYTVFSRYGKNYRKGIHKAPHFTKITSRVNPKGF